jgi:signal transduction histidine kinase
MSHGWRHRVLRRNSLERRLFSWLLALLLVPAIVAVSLSLYVGSRSVEWMGTLGPWDQVAESGRDLVHAAAPAARSDTALAAALRAHERELSASVTQARRWSFLGDRVLAVLPITFAVLLLLLAGAALWISRRLARELARPIHELVEWTGRLGAGEALPAERAHEHGEVAEVRTLRRALRDAAARIAEARARALEAERVRAWGEMARRVAHEMKNPLTPLRLAVHRITRAAADDERLREPLAVLQEESARLEELARQFAVLGRPSSGPVSDIDIRELLQSLVETDVPPGIQVAVHADPQLPLLLGHYDALQRAFRNLLRNAVEAVLARAQGELRSPGEQIGRIEIHATLGGISDDSATGSGGPDGSITICIADDGCGIAPEHLDRIFEPDYTLKAGGTGLGLAVVRQAVLAHGGTITARASNAGGAEFEVHLPLGRVAAAPPAGVAEDPRSAGVVSRAHI